MHFLIRLGLLALVTAAPALAEITPVRVFIPRGIATSDVNTGDSQKPGFKYVTIESLHIVNPSRHEAQAYEPKNFHLLVDDKTYLPTVRPGLGALDLHEGSALAPGASTDVTVSFLVPDDTTKANFEFTPHWQSDAGFTVDWCCEYQ
jgi:Domain of unknown function (DUF4352)